MFISNDNLIRLGSLYFIIILLTLQCQNFENRHCIKKEKNSKKMNDYQKISNLAIESPASVP